MPNPIAKVISGIDRLDGRPDEKYFHLRIKRKGGAIHACSAAKSSPESKFCKNLTFRLGVLADMASKIPSFKSIAQVKRSSTKRPRWKKIPTKEEFYGSYLIDRMISGMILGRSKPSDSLKQLLHIIPFEDLTKKARQAGKRLGMPSYQKIDVTTSVGAYVMLESLGKMYGFNVDMFMPNELLYQEG